jgi:nitrogen fixation protein NifU and related proteins
VSEADRGPTDAELAAVFQDTILEHYRRPWNKREMTDADAAITKRNPMCADEITLFVEMDGDRIKAATFTGVGCSIAQASASMMTSRIAGMNAEEVSALRASIDRMLAGDRADDSLGEMKAFAGVAKFPARFGCVRLPFDALAEAMLRGPA